MSELNSLQFRVEPAAVRALAAEFEQAGFSSLEPLYGGHVNHDCSNTLTLAIGDRTHTVRAFAQGKPPEVIGQLVSRVESVARIDRFRQRETAAAGPSVNIGHFANLLERLTWVWPEALDLQARLQGTRISTTEAAERVAWSAFNARKGGVQSDEVVQISGLYQVGREMAGFAGPDDLVWEARLWRGAGTSEVIWISTKTGAVLTWTPGKVTPASESLRRPR
jgi:hypothetical protein